MNNIKALIILLCTGGFCNAQNPDTVYHSYVLNGIIVGEQKSWKTSSREFHYAYHAEYGNRFKTISETVVTDSNEQIIALNGTGVDFFGMPFDERFSIVNDSAIWSINGIVKTRKFNQEVYGQSSCPGADELKLRWLLRQKNNRGFTFPHDTIYLNKPLFRSISYAGKIKNVALCAIYYPPDDLPEYIWVTDKFNFFARLTSGRGYILKGYENWVDTLLNLQLLSDSGYYARQMAENSITLPNHLLITHATLFESATANIRKDISVEVIGGKIASIFSSSENRETHADTILDVHGKFLMPGLWDMHSHYSQPFDGLWKLVSGITHIRDMGNADIIRLYQRQIRENKLLGPDISYISLLLDRVPTIGVVVTSQQDAVAAIERYRALGYDQLKIYNSIKPEWAPAMIDRAHSLGMRVAGHIPDGMSTHQAIAEGYNEITHLNSIYLDYIDDDSLRKSGMQFGRIAARRSGTLDLQCDSVQQLLRLLKEKSIAVDPTLQLHEDLWMEFKGDSSNVYKPVINWMPVSERAQVIKDHSYGTEEEKPLLIASFNNNLKLIKLLFDDGIRIVAGTDKAGGFVLDRELEIYNNAGIPASEVLKIATYTAALDCNLEKKYGQILVGREADMILIDGDPVKKMSDLRRVEWVVKNHRMYLPKTLLLSKGWSYYY